jgi:hypothetical protein
MPEFLIQFQNVCECNRWRIPLAEVYCIEMQFLKEEKEKERERESKKK